MSPMRKIVEVPTSTMLADLDDALRNLLRGQLTQHGYEGADVVFDTPTKDWAAKLTRPTVDVFLCDLRRSQDEVEQGTTQTRGPNGRAIDRPVPLRIDISYAISAWSTEVVDEHRLLSQVLAVLNSHPVLDEDVLGPRLLDGSQRYPITARVADDRSEKRSDFWQSVGGHYKPAIDYVVTLAMESGMVIEAGPDVRTATVRTRSLDRPRAIATELHHLGGRVLDGSGEPVADAWVALPAIGRYAETDDQGHFRVGPVPSGSHACHARAADGRAAELTVTVPGPPLDIELGTTAKPRAARRSGS
jgi:hypothetical protein